MKHILYLLALMPFAAFANPSPDAPKVVAAKQAYISPL